MHILYVIYTYILIYVYIHIYRIHIYICIYIYIMICESVWHVYPRPSRGSLEHSNKFAPFGKPFGDIAAAFLATF